MYTSLLIHVYSKIRNPQIKYGVSVFLSGSNLRGTISANPPIMQTMKFIPSLWIFGNDHPILLQDTTYIYPMSNDNRLMIITYACGVKSISDSGFECVMVKF